MQPTDNLTWPRNQSASHSTTLHQLSASACRSLKEASRQKQEFVGLASPSNEQSLGNENGKSQLDITISCVPSRVLLSPKIYPRSLCEITEYYKN